MKHKLLLGALALLAGSTAYAQTKPESFIYNGEVIYGVRTIPGVNLAGTYLFEGGEPRVELNADGTGCWANHSRPCQKIRWWLHSNAKGELAGASNEVGAVHTIMFEHVENPANGRVGAFTAYQLAVDKLARTISIADERIKSY